MWLFIIIMAVTFFLTALAVVFSEEYDWRSSLGMICGILSVIGWISIIIMLICIIVSNVGIQGQITANQQIYDSLVYQLENDLYDNDNDLGKKELYDQVQAWNANIAKGKALQSDPWVGWFYPNIYDQFEFIALE